MIVDLLFLIILIIYLIIASITDIKTREVPDWLSYSLIITAFAIKGIHSILSKDPSYFLYGLLGFGIFFLIGNLMYYTKQWGGGDAKLLMGMGIILITYPETLIKYFNPSLKVPFLLSLIINIFIVGALYSIILSIIFAIKNKKEFKEKFKITFNLPKIKLMRIVVPLTSLILIILTLIIVKDNIIKLTLMSLFVFAVLILYLLIFIKAVEKTCMFKKIKVKNLREGDWITKEIKNIYSPKSLGVTNKQIELIQKTNIKEVIVKDGLPFVPPILIGTIISLIFGNLIFL